MRHFTRRSIFALGFASLVACSSPTTDAAADTATDAAADAAADTAADAATDTSTATDREPPPNPTLADSPWPGSHRSSYAQGSSDLPGPTAPGLDAEHVYLSGSPITLSFSGLYPDGGRAIWASPLNSTGSVLKLDAETLALIDEYVPAEREDNPPQVALGISGAYNLVDVDDRFIAGRTRAIEVYEDATSGDRDSTIALATRFGVPNDVFCGSDDIIVGMTMTYDGAVAFVTQNGVVATIPRDPAQMTADNVARLSLNGDACGQPRAELETVSNSIAADEDGGIYVVTSGAMYRVDWDGGALTLGWRAEYETGDGQAGVRLGAGSGSTPSLMGAGDQDRFVVLTDGQPLMHLVLMWRDDVPEGWEPVRAGADPRIACEVPIRFGDPDADVSLSEQSVLVRGHAAVVVNNLLADPGQFVDELPLLQNIFSALEGGNPEQAPNGIERVDWDPATQSCVVVWSNPAPSIPNAIPTMSDATGLIYAHGQREGGWGLYALDFDTGDVAFFEPAPSETCDGVLDRLAQIERLALADTLERLPNSCENSFYGAAEVGPDGALFQGTWYGVTRYR